MTAAVIALSLSQVPGLDGSGAAVGQTAVSGSALSSRLSEPERAAPERCRDARRGVAWYIRAAWRWERLSYQPLLRVATSGRSCRQARAAAKRLRLEARRAHLIYKLWLRTPKLFGERPFDISNVNPVNRNLIRLAICETGGINGGRPLWTHRTSTYVGALGFRLSTWRTYRHRVRPLPPREGSHASPVEQLAVGRALVREFSGYSSWPACHRRLGLPG